MTNRDNTTANESSIDVSSSGFYPFYLIKRRSSHNKSRQSLQSWDQRHKYRLVRRLVRKSGKSSIQQKLTKERSFRFILDSSHTLIDGSWFWILLILSLVFILTWTIFAGFWAIISIENVDNYNGTSDSCLEGVKGFGGYLLFSIETQTTIGYGGRYINEYCLEAIIGLCIQLIIGVGVCGSLICIVFLKMERPLQYSTFSFSKKAVICQRDGELCLIFRVRDCDRRYECHTKIVAYLVKGKGGELSMKELKLEPPGILIWPVEIIHKINDTSPFWDISAKDLMEKRFEIILILEGESLSTSYMSRATTSYLSREIKWGYKFTKCTEWNKEESRYIVNHKLFHKTEELLMPLCSAQRLKEVCKDIEYSHIIPQSSYTESSSKFSSPITMSPVISTTTKTTKWRNINEDSCSDSDSMNNSKIITVAKIHNHFQANDDDESDLETVDGSDNEMYYASTDLSTEDLCDNTNKRNDAKDVTLRNKTSKADETRPKTNSTTITKDLFGILQKYVSDNKNKSKKSFEETAL